MSRAALKGPLITIALGAQNSDAVNLAHLSAAVDFTLFGVLTPDSATHDYVIQLSYDGGTTYNTLTANGVDVEAPATGYSSAYAMPAATHMRIRDKTGVTTGTTTFQMYFSEAIYNTGF